MYVDFNIFQTILLTFFVNKIFLDFYHMQKILQCQEDSIHNLTFSHVIFFYGTPSIIHVCIKNINAQIKMYKQFNRVEASFLPNIIYNSSIQYFGIFYESVFTKEHITQLAAVLIIKQMKNTAKNCDNIIKRHI